MRIHIQGLGFALTAVKQVDWLHENARLARRQPLSGLPGNAFYMSKN